MAVNVPLTKGTRRATGSWGVELLVNGGVGVELGFR